MEIDYVTKWTEAKPLLRIREIEVIHFFMEHIVFRFGVPRVVVTDNGTQFTGKDWEDTLSQLKIQHVKASVAYIQENGQVEITNKLFSKVSRNDSSKPKEDELPNVLWSHRTTPKTAIGETPFRLAYGTEAILSVEISTESLRIKNFDPKTSEEGLHLNNDLVDELRDSAQLKVAH